MVEFGLKLEDNKVNDWADQYIDYEKLKAVLKKVKASVEYRDEIVKRASPGVAAEVLQERKDRAASSSVENRTDNEEKLEYSSSLEATQHNRESSFSSMATDSTPLLSGEPKPLKRKNSWGNNIKKVASYLGLADEREILHQAYDDADNKLDLFKQSYEYEVSNEVMWFMLEEHTTYLINAKLWMYVHSNFLLQVNKVRSFYQQKTDEISERMDILVENVGSSGLKVNKPKESKRSSLVDKMTQKFESMLYGMSSHVNANNNDAIPGMGIEFSESLEDDEDPEQKLVDEMERKKKKEEFVRNTDSIKRAITDIYRTAKLLHNYSIMVSSFFDVVVCFSLM